MAFFTGILTQKANGVFIGASQLENEKFWREIECPTCIVSGVLSHEYWSRAYFGHEIRVFSRREMEKRARFFKTLNIIGSKILAIWSTMMNLTDLQTFAWDSWRRSMTGNYRKRSTNLRWKRDRNSSKQISSS